MAMPERLIYLFIEAKFYNIFGNVSIGGENNVGIYAACDMVMILMRTKATADITYVGEDTVFIKNLSLRNSNAIEVKSDDDITNITSSFSKCSVKNVSLEGFYELSELVPSVHSVDCSNIGKHHFEEIHFKLFKREDLDTTNLLLELPFLSHEIPLANFWFSFIFFFFIFFVMKYISKRLAHYVSVLSRASFCILYFIVQELHSKRGMILMDFPDVIPIRNMAKIRYLLAWNMVQEMSIAEHLPCDHVVHSTDSLVCGGNANINATEHSDKSSIILHDRGVLSPAGDEILNPKTSEVDEVKSDGCTGSIMFEGSVIAEDNISPSLTKCGNYCTLQQPWQGQQCEEQIVYRKGTKQTLAEIWHPW